MHDTVRLEALGVPSVGIVSSGFAQQSAVQAASLGCEAAFRVFVQHPISDQTPAQMAAKARDCFDDVQRALAGVRAEAPAAPAAGGCDGGV